jgi:hypothetical protein
LTEEIEKEDQEKREKTDKEKLENLQKEYDLLKNQLKVSLTRRSSLFSFSAFPFKFSLFFVLPSSSLLFLHHQEESKLRADAEVNVKLLEAQLEREKKNVERLRAQLEKSDRTTEQQQQSKV